MILLNGNNKLNNETKKRNWRNNYYPPFFIYIKIKFNL